MLVIRIPCPTPLSSTGPPLATSPSGDLEFNKSLLPRHGWGVTHCSRVSFSACR